MLHCLGLCLADQFHFLPPSRPYTQRAMMMTMFIIINIESNAKEYLIFFLSFLHSFLHLSINLLQFEIVCKLVVCLFVCVCESLYYLLQPTDEI